MRGKRAKQIRAAARTLTEGLPEREYGWAKPNKTTLNRRRMFRTGILIRLAPTCTRAVYQAGKAGYLSAIRA